MNFYTETYTILKSFFGRQYWWPAQSKDEIIIGSVLTQNTSWNNVQKALDNLRGKNLISLKKIYNADIDVLKECIRPSGFFNSKAIYLKNISEYFHSYKYDYNRIDEIDTEKLRTELLKIKGIGRETCDSILLYVLNRPVFVVDAYTKRVFSRHINDFPDEYEQIKALLEKNVRKNVNVYNEYHALIVNLAKTYCRKKPLCEKCPLRTEVEGGNL